MRRDNSSRFKWMKSLNVLALLLAMQVNYAQPIMLGPTYPIQEDHLLQWIQQRLRHWVASGAIKRQQRQIRLHLLNPLRDSHTVWRNLPRALRDRIYYQDPTTRLSHTVTTPDGHILGIAGQTLNPLDVVQLSHPLLFYDARDKRQQQWVQQWQAKHAVRLVLTAGSIVSQVQRLHQRVYADQHGRLTRRLGITHVPALVTQVNRRLQIHEVAVS